MTDPSPSQASVLYPMSLFFGPKSGDQLESLYQELACTYNTNTFSTKFRLQLWHEIRAALCLSCFLEYLRCAVTLVAPGLKSSWVCIFIKSLMISSWKPVALELVHAACNNSTTYKYNIYLSNLLNDIYQAQWIIFFFSSQFNSIQCLLCWSLLL